MKKSKIIVPALGILLLSTAASVSGTVAWFTAVRNFTANVGNFAVVKTTADLQCDFKGLVGTTEAKINSGDTYNKLLNVDANTVLTDGSFDHTDKHAAYPVNTAGDKFAEISTLGFSVKATDEAVTGVKRGQTKTGQNIFTLFTWNMTFHYESETSFETALLFNLDDGQSSATSTPADATTKEGFRIAFVNVANGRTIVWAPFRADGDTTELKYVSSVSAGVASTTNYVTAAGASHNLITSTKTGVGTLSSIEDGDKTQDQLSAMTNYLGKFSTSVNELEFNCAAWYEGSDSAVESDKTLATIATVLSFDARIIKAA